MLFGKYGVWLFFVISGFCIHLQWVRARVVPGARQLSFAEFWRRRIWRLYPPYLVTLVFYVWLRHLQGELPWNALTAWKIGLHAVMLQNVDTRALNAMNNVYWTLAVEEQLYLLYFVFLAIRQRFGWRAMLTTALAARAGWFGLAMAVHRVWGVDIVVTQAAAAQWFVWILGALAVEASYGLVVLPRWTRDRGLAAATLGLAGVLAWAQNYWLTPGLASNVVWLAGDVVWGVGFFVLLNWAVAHEPAWSAARRARGTAAWLASVGLFSYSLYLTHEIVEWRAWPVVAAWLARSGNLLPQIVVMAILTAASLLFARAFFELFERPFLRRPWLAPAPAPHAARS